ncbi:hypothetical protein [Roseicyclus mahoneyensis]|uniref:Uncharacterized protein n=1 Tax=Roseicyclus mahoneyensis TaxID=164332 RepID=A0A316GJJ3_9RHOB|nr:hypothetical protein [Roseicyclus mahoneyensis]PWK60951.1 hypothetical protein C7455_103151 [Roseicyclus mahoneyensis]
MHTRPPPLLPDIAPVAMAADLLSEFGGGCCPSVTALLERLIDRQATPATGGRRR